MLPMVGPTCSRDTIVTRSVTSTGRAAKATSSPVDVAASVYMHDLHRAGVINDAVDHPVVTSASRVQAAELGAEGPAYSLWIASERSEDEPEAGRGDLCWQPL